MDIFKNLTLKPDHYPPMPEKKHFFDTQFERLKVAGFTDEQAKVQIDLHKERFTLSVDRNRNLITQNDLELKLILMESRLIKWMVSMVFSVVVVMTAILTVLIKFV